MGSLQRLSNIMLMALCLVPSRFPDPFSELPRKCGAVSVLSQGWRHICTALSKAEN